MVFDAGNNTGTLQAFPEPDLWSTGFVLCNLLICDMQTYVAVLLLQFVLLIVERVLYLYRSLLGKALLHATTVIVFFVLSFVWVFTLRCDRVLSVLRA